MKQRFNYGLGLKRASPNSMKAFFLSFWKNFVIFFAFGIFGFVLAHKKAFSITTNKELDLL
ncbi:hypothetical protein N202_02315 [Helicobacter pylori UM067]|nr:hypothetical protein N202_02315 [Helicobacter pylori UM067]